MAAAVYLFDASSGGAPTTPRKMHSAHLAQHPNYPPRAPVANPDWDVPEPGYAPVPFTAEVVLQNDRTKKPKGWADPADFTRELRAEVGARHSAAAEWSGGMVPVDDDGLPRNPMGRTGMVGRGLLGKWGPNWAADPIVTRFNAKGKLQMVAIERGDTRVWAIPGGMVDEGEHVSATLKREFYEEAQNLESEAQSQVIKKQLDTLFASGGSPVFVGYVDDPRNTDNAWMETSAYHFHIDDPDLAAGLKLHAGDDAVGVQWLAVDDAVPEFKQLYASHRDMVVRAVQLKIESTKGTPEHAMWVAAGKKVGLGL
jgi:ADP-ribose pyrophosphatase